MSGHQYPSTLFQSIQSIDWSTLLMYPHQIKIWQDFVGEPEMPVMQPLSHYNKRKAWESNYDPKFHQKGGEIKVSKAASTSSLPDKKWVLPKIEGDTLEDRIQKRKEMLQWLTAQKFKYQVCLVEIDKKEREVFLFKKEKLALMFKLAWG
jgi:hypothetical protein